MKGRNDLNSLHTILTSKLSMNSIDRSVCDKGNLQDKLNIFISFMKKRGKKNTEI